MLAEVVGDLQRLALFKAESRLEPCGRFFAQNEVRKHPLPVADIFRREQPHVSLQIRGLHNRELAVVPRRQLVHQVRVEHQRARPRPVQALLIKPERAAFRFHLHFPAIVRKLDGNVGGDQLVLRARLDVVARKILRVAPPQGRDGLERFLAMQMEGQAFPEEIVFPPHDQVRVEIPRRQPVKIAEFLPAVGTGENVVREPRRELFPAVRAVHLDERLVVDRVERRGVISADFFVQLHSPQFPLVWRRRRQPFLVHDGDMPKLQIAVNDGQRLMAKSHAGGEVRVRRREGYKMPAVGAAHAAFLHIGVHGRAAILAGKRADGNGSSFSVGHVAHLLCDYMENVFLCVRTEKRRQGDGQQQNFIGAGRRLSI